MKTEYPIIFVVGALIGAGTSWFFTRRFYKALADEEIESVKESFSYLQKKDQERADVAKNKPPIDVLTKYLDEQNEQKPTDVNVDHSTLDDIKDVDTNKVNYSNYSDKTEPEPQKQVVESELEEEPYKGPINSLNDIHDGPYILNTSPSEAEPPYYTVVTLIYYADGTYADQHGTEHEVEDYIGRAMMEYVEKTNKDEIVVRNDELQLDIDIVKDARTYDEVMFG